MGDFRNSLFSRNLAMVTLLNMRPLVYDSLFPFPGEKALYDTGTGMKVYVAECGLYGREGGPAGMDKIIAAARAAGDVPAQDGSIHCLFLLSGFQFEDGGAEYQDIAGMLYGLSGYRYVYLLCGGDRLYTFDIKQHASHLIIYPKGLKAMHGVLADYFTHGAGID